MSETTSLIQNHISVTVKPRDRETPGDGSSEFSSPIDKSLFRKIEFHLPRKPLTNGGGADSFQLERLNPTTTSSNSDRHRVAYGPVIDDSSVKKRDASELDPENNYRITFRRIGAGLENLGNTCYLNSVLQCLTYTEPLAAYLQSGKHQITCRNAGFCALCAIQKHVSSALQSSGKSLAPKDLVSNLRSISQTFRSYRQEDAHEYMVNLLESMHKCCLPSAYERSLVHDIFGGRLRSQVKCMQCNYCSNKFDPFLDLSLEISKADTLYKAFADFTAKEQLDGGAKQYNCQQCKEKVKALKQLTIHEAPNVLSIHLKRFGSDMSGEKIDKKVHFSPTLDLKPFVTGPYNGDLKYTLYGVLVHAGWSTHSGHYYCFVRTSSGMWYSLDDNQVIQVSERTVFEQKAYMLFYFRDRKNSPSKKPADVHQEEMVNVPSVLHESMKPKISVEKGRAIDDVAKPDSSSLGDVATIPSTSNGPQKLGPMNDKNEAFSTAVKECEDKRNTREDLSDSTTDVAPDDFNGGDDCPRGAITCAESSSSSKAETFSIEERVFYWKKHKKTKNNMKVKVKSMKFCSNILVGASLNQRKKKKHKRKKRSKLAIENSGSQVEARTSGMLVNRVERSSNHVSGGNPFELRGFKSSNDYMSLRCKKESVHMLTADFVDRTLTVPRWDEDKSTPSQIREIHDVRGIGYVGNEWDREYDRGKRLRHGFGTKFDGRNQFQDIANKRLNFRAGRRRSNKHLKHLKKSSSGNRPFRI